MLKVKEPTSQSDQQGDQQEKPKISKRQWKYREKLLEHYKKTMRQAIYLPQILMIGEHSWSELASDTAQMVTDIGAEETAKMFEEWVRLIREGRFGEFDGLQMSSLSKLDKSLTD